MAKELKITSIEGNRQKLDGGAMFGNAPRALWSKWYNPDEKGRIELACRSMLVETSSSKWLFETGIGAFFEPKLASRYGVEGDEHVLLQSLLAEGVSHEDIDFVVLSHLHFDHAGGLLPAFKDGGVNGDLLFPNAKYVVGRESLERANAPHFRDRASFIPQLIEKISQSERLVVIEDHEGGDKLGFEGLTFTYSDGHTPGQMHSVIKGEKHTVIFAGDLVPGTHWVHLPITMGYDRYPEKLIDEKGALYQKFLDENLRLFYTHDKDWAWSGIELSEKGKYQAIHEESILKGIHI